MGILSQAADAAYAFRFLKLFVTPFEKTKAFELGIIDEKGKNLRPIRKLGLQKEKAAYTPFIRLVFNFGKIV